METISDIPALKGRSETPVSYGESPAQRTPEGPHLPQAPHCLHVLPAQVQCRRRVLPAGRKGGLCRFAVTHFLASPAGAETLCQASRRPAAGLRDAASSAPRAMASEGPREPESEVRADGGSLGSLSPSACLALGARPGGDGAGPAGVGRMLVTARERPTGWPRSSRPASGPPWGGGQRLQTPPTVSAASVVRCHPAQWLRPSSALPAVGAGGLWRASRALGNG